MSQRSTADTLAYLRSQRTSGSTAWGGLCLKLQRTARNIPAVYPSAISAQHATPSAHRVTSLPNVKRGMVAYFDDANDSNPYGHITAVAGRAKDGELLHWTNDVPGSGRVSLVRHSFFPKYWGDSFQFAATWLNGQELDMPEKKAPQPPLADGAERIERAIELLKGAAETHRKKGHDRLVRALERDITHLKELHKKFGGKR